MSKIVLIVALAGAALVTSIAVSNATVQQAAGITTLNQSAGHNESGECRNGGDHDGDRDC